MLRSVDPEPSKRTLGVVLELCNASSVSEMVLMLLNSRVMSGVKTNGTKVTKSVHLLI
jgi:hypothetical protein